VFDACLYPRAGLTSAEKLAFYARFFRAVEIRAAFWDDTLTADDARAWIGAVADAPGFLFNVKLHASFTHGKTIRPDLARRVREILQALHRHERLGSLLVQFPYSFTNTGSNRQHLVKLAGTFAGSPLHVEFRHQSWNQDSLAPFLEDHALGIVSADMPRIRQYMPFVATVCGATAYLRLHGRNEKGWMLNGYDARYDYQYNSREVREITRRLRGLDRRSKNVMVICNNTTGGKSVPVAFQLLASISGGAVAIPPRALEAFPFLRSIARDESGETPLLDTGYRRAI